MTDYYDNSVYNRVLISLAIEERDKKALLTLGMRIERGGNRARKLVAKYRDQLRQTFKIVEGVGEWFPWPKTDVELSARISGRLMPDDFAHRSFLGHLGYSVGKSGISSSGRRKVLDDAYSLPRDKLTWDLNSTDPEEPRSAQRLSCIANILAAHIRNAKRKKQDYSVAIADWEDDLGYLKKKYYDGRYDAAFKWIFSS